MKDKRIPVRVNSEVLEAFRDINQHGMKMSHLLHGLIRATVDIMEEADNKAYTIKGMDDLLSLIRVMLPDAVKAERTKAYKYYFFKLEQLIRRKCMERVIDQTKEIPFQDE